MTRDAVRAWLNARKPAPPDALRVRLHRALEEVPPTPGSRLPAYLAQVGHQLLADVTACPGGGRELALDLLAADAFATYVFEAEAEESTT